jgi:hypothetical protein
LDVNPYEVLGVRPSAGSDEIELALKGRRSQYHPDRYAEADAETQQWATEKTKEVNAAYRILSTPELRAQCDERWLGKGRKAADPAETAKPPAPDFAAALLKPSWTWFHDKVYAKPNIPRAKFDGAKASYAPAVAFGDVLLLVDDTLFGGAREGLLVTKDGLYARQKFEEARYIRLEGVRSVDVGPSNRLMVNGAKFFEGAMVEAPAMDLLATRLNVALKECRATPSSDGSNTNPGPAAELAGLHRLHRRALTEMRGQLGDRTLLIDMLIDEQMQSLLTVAPTLARKVQSMPQRSPGPLDAEVAEALLPLFLALHYFSLSQLPRAFMKPLGPEFTGFHEVSEGYKLAYVWHFRQLFERPVQGSDDDLMSMALMFFHRDGEGPVDLRLPRRQVLEHSLTRFGLHPSDARELIQRFQDLATAWVPKFLSLLADLD